MFKISNIKNSLQGILVESTGSWLSQRKKIRDCEFLQAMIYNFYNFMRHRQRATVHMGRCWSRWEIRGHFTEWVNLGRVLRCYMVTCRWLRGQRTKRLILRNKTRKGALPSLHAMCQVLH